MIDGLDVLGDARNPRLLQCRHQQAHAELLEILRQPRVIDVIVRRQSMPDLSNRDISPLEVRAQCRQRAGPAEVHQQARPTGAHHPDVGGAIADIDDGRCGTRGHVEIWPKHNLRRQSPCDGCVRRYDGGAPRILSSTRNHAMSEHVPADPSSPASPRALTRRDAVQRMAFGAAVLPAILRGRYQLSPGISTEYSARAIRLVQDSLVLDLLNQFRFADFADKPPRITSWLTKPRSMTAAEFEVYRTSGYNVIALGHGPTDYASGIRFFADWNGFIAEYSDWFMRVDDATDFLTARTSKKVGLMMTFQNSDHFRTVDDVDTFWGLGQRLSQLTYNYQNRIGSGFLETNDGGLTVFGREIVARMEKVGMAVDLSHCGDRTTLDTLDVATKPVVFSHASCRALVPGHLRCKTDEMITKMARTGGVMGMPFLRMMIRETEPVTVEHILDHFDHVTKLVGIDHVAVGSDMDVVGNPNPVNGETMSVPPTPNFDRYRMHFDAKGERMLTVEGMNHPKRMFDVAEGLIRRRYSDANIAAILGGNAARVLTTIWKG